MPGAVLVTRPQPGAGRTAARLRARGHEAVELPLTAIVPLAVAGPIPIDVDTVVATSANALRHLSDLPEELRRLPFHAVGADTAAEARAAGFETVHAGESGAAGLADIVIGATARSARILFLCGRVRLPDFERRLKASGRTIVALETYDTQQVDYTQEELTVRLGTEPLRAALLYSREAARLFVEQARRSPLREVAAGARLLCLSARVAEPLEAVRDRVSVAKMPQEDALLALLPSPGG